MDLLKIIKQAEDNAKAVQDALMADASRREVMLDEHAAIIQERLGTMVLPVFKKAVQQLAEKGFEPWIVQGKSTGKRLHEISIEFALSKNGLKHGAPIKDFHLRWVGDVERLHFKMESLTYGWPSHTLALFPAADLTSSLVEQELERFIADALAAGSKANRVPSMPEGKLLNEDEVMRIRERRRKPGTKKLWTQWFWQIRHWWMVQRYRNHGIGQGRASSESP